MASTTQCLPPSVAGRCSKRIHVRGGMPEVFPITIARRLAPELVPYVMEVPLDSY